MARLPRLNSNLLPAPTDPPSVGMRIISLAKLRSYVIFYILTCVNSSVT